MPRPRIFRPLSPTMALAMAAGLGLLIPTVAEAATAACTTVSETRLVPKDRAACAALAEKMRDPSALPLNLYEDTVNSFFGQYCHRDAEAGWVRDKRVRDAGPFTATLSGGAWTGQDFGTHAPVVVWYSPEAFAWLKQTRPNGADAVADAPPPPDGAMIVKEMYPAPAAACDGVEPEYLRPTSGAAFMVRDGDASFDGWFWGWYGFPTLDGKSTFTNDWPAGPGNPLANMGFGQYCTNCHGSATNSSSFASLRNIQGQPGQPLVFLSQNFFQGPLPESHHGAPGDTSDDPKTVGAAPAIAFDPVFMKVFANSRLKPPADTAAITMPSQTYDVVWAPPGHPKAAGTFLTSDQCMGCHDAGSTGLQFDMTRPAPHPVPGGPGLINDSPYGTWGSSPMGLGGRDPIFFAQLASETQSFHPENAPEVEGICFGCHGVQGERQFAIDTAAAGDTSCPPFRRSMVDAMPFPPGNPGAAHANYGALARDGISCLSCHRMEFGDAAARLIDQPQNACIAERQALLNPDNTGFAKTFTGSFLVGGPGAVLGPFPDPQTRPMLNALNIEPKHHPAITTSEVCGSCHTVHLPVLHKGEVVGRVYEQTTYPEWAFGAYRTGTGPNGEALPSGAGDRAQTCQDCHMPSTDAAGKPLVSKIASIQEFSNFPETENNLGPEEIDLEPRSGFAKHTLVGLNYFLVKIAQQFPDVLGLRTQDPMLVGRGVPPLEETEAQMLAQAAQATADITVTKVGVTGDALEAVVGIASKTGHKFPSGVGFRRAFVEFRVLDAAGGLLWASGRTDPAGVIIDQDGKPVAGEIWWTPGCERVGGTDRPHQPHYQTVNRQDQVQIYQELVSTPPATGTFQCGHDVAPQGELTTSFLSICAEVKDNRILPHGYLPLPARVEIAKALGAGAELAEDAGTAVTDDPDYVTGGGDSLVYRVPLADLKGAAPAAVQATLYYQAIPPFYLQDRFCTAQGPDAQRLLHVTGKLNLSDTPAAGWKLRVVETPVVKVP